MQIAYTSFSIILMVVKIETYWNIIFIPPAKDRKLIITIQRIFTYERKTHFSR